MYLIQCLEQGRWEDGREFRTKQRAVEAAKIVARSGKRVRVVAVLGDDAPDAWETVWDKE